MEIIRTISQMRQWHSLQAGRSIGFTPTMGALHRGHLSLVRRSCEENEVTAVSIFVNPTQFNNQSDLANYPRTLDADIEFLRQTRCDAVFAPDTAEMYPAPDSRVFDFGALDKVMEGKFRCGHFNGVAQIVSRLFDILPAARAYFGEKDFQQTVIVRELVRQLGLSVEIVVCPVVREKDGLAMSSRNTLLTPQQRIAAPLIARTLFEAADMVCSSSIGKIRQFVARKINANPFMKLEYFEIVNTATLQPANSWDEECSKQGCIAVQMDSVRLIDNVRMA